MVNPPNANACIWRKRLIVYGFAFAITALATVVRLSLNVWLGDRLTLMLFILPILFSAYVGGVGPGLLATALSAAGVYYFLLAGVHILSFEGSGALFNWVMFIVNGVVVSLLIEALHRSRRQVEATSRLHAVTLESIGDAVITTDSQGRVTFLNAEAERLTEWTNPEAQGQPLAGVFHVVNEATQQPMEDPAQKVLRTGTVVGLANHTLLLGRHGRKTLIDDSGAPITEHDGHVAGVVLVFRDCTEKKKAEEALRDRERLLRQVIDLVPHFIFAKDRQSRHLFANRACAEAHGLTVEEIAGRSDLDLVADKKQAEAFIRDDLEVIANGKPKIIPEEQITLQDGSVRILETIKMPFNMPGQSEPAVLGVAIDITARKAAEQALRQLAVIVESSEEAIIGSNLERLITSWNRGAKNVFGYAAEEILGKSVLQLYPPELQHEFPDIFARLARGESIEHFQTERVRKDGKRIRIAATISPLKDVHGVVVGAAMIAHDVSRQQILEEQLRQSQKMEAIGQLAGGVAHDFNNILAVIQMQIELAKMDGQVSNEQAACLDEIQTAATRGANLTRQLLLFSQRQRPQPRQLDLSDSIGGMTKMLRRILGEHIHIQFKYAPQPLFIHADAGMIDQVLMNLTLNSRDAMPGGGLLVIQTSPVEIDELAALQSVHGRQGSFVRLSVSDTGCGIPPEILPRIFEPFFTTKDVGKGTGLGLATVFSIIQQHQGWVDVLSELGRGTTFDIYLPRQVKSSPQAAEPTAEPAMATAGTETILLVEDDDALRASIHRCLSQLGYNMLAAASGVAALEVWQQHRDQIHLLLTDLVMPGGVTGKELGERLQREKLGLKVIYISGYTADILTRDFSPGADIAFLAKPFPAQVLIQTVRGCLDKK